jgi:hypothetical protein
MAPVPIAHDLTRTAREGTPAPSSATTRCADQTVRLQCREGSADSRAGDPMGDDELRLTRQGGTGRELSGFHRFPQLGCDLATAREG